MIYPDDIFLQRDIENVPGVEFDATKQHQIFAEDYQDLGGEITVIESILGTNPNGDFPTVKEWLQNLKDRVTLLEFFIFDMVRQIFYDGFPGSTLNATNWSNWGGGQISVSGGQLLLTTTTSPGYYGINSAPVPFFEHGYMEVEVASVGNQALGSLEFYPVLLSGVTTSDQVFFLIGGGDIQLYKKVGGSSTFIASATYNAVTHKYLRLRIAYGRIFGEYSSDEATWNILGSSAAPFSFDQVYFYIQVGTWNTEATSTVPAIEWARFVKLN